MQGKSTNGPPASGFLASVARKLSSHWKRSLAAAVGVLVLLVLAAGAGGKGTDDYSIPGTESQQAVDLFKAHSPAFGGADSTLVFTVDKGQVSDPAPKAAIEGALVKVRGLDGVKLAASPFVAGGQVSEDGRLAAVDVRYSTPFRWRRAGRSSTWRPSRTPPSARSSACSSRSCCSPSCSAPRRR